MFSKLLDVLGTNLVKNGGKITIKDDPSQYEVEFNDVEQLRKPKVQFNARVLREIITQVVP